MAHTKEVRSYIISDVGKQSVPQKLIRVAIEAHSENVKSIYMPPTWALDSLLWHFMMHKVVWGDSQETTQMLHLNE